jgi:hypothetical protein
LVVQWNLTERLEHFTGINFDWLCLDKG